MKLKDAIIKRINEILEEKDLKVNDLALNSYMTSSTMYDLVNGVTNHVQVNTIKKICFGAGITLSEFFDREYFDNFDEMF